MIAYLVNCTNVIISQIESGSPQREIAKTYCLAMSSEGAEMDAPDWKKINAAIVTRWSVSGLERVKKMAHGDPFGVRRETSNA
jgi:hypothetical protein